MTQLKAATEKEEKEHHFLIVTVSFWAVYRIKHGTYLQTDRALETDPMLQECQVNINF